MDVGHETEDYKAQTAHFGPWWRDVCDIEGVHVPTTELEICEKKNRKSMFRKWLTVVVKMFMWKLLNEETYIEGDKEAQEAVRVLLLPLHNVNSK